MPLHRLPGAARRDADLFVVVTGGAARGKSIAQPEMVLSRELVSDVGERRGALVGGDHEIRIVSVVANEIGRRNDAGGARANIVGDVEQRGDKWYVGRNAFSLDSF